MDDSYVTVLDDRVRLAHVRIGAVNLEIGMNVPSRRGCPIAVSAVPPSCSRHRGFTAQQQCPTWGSSRRGAESGTRGRRCAAREVVLGAQHGGGVQFLVKPAGSMKVTPAGRRRATGWVATHAVRGRCGWWCPRGGDDQVRCGEGEPSGARVR